ncbi:hypothetical protein WMF31_34955 [Sorangium sp. So ce1036]|uniref:hypothetical protein n=1 Tax=Sorangium sp. So ce1036 TaxID=3133328 RepID=UPI003F126174
MPTATEKERRDDLHRLVDELPEGEVQVARRFLVYLRDVGRSEPVRKDRGEPKGRLLDLKGLGRELWRGEDAQAYVDAMRDEWDR